MVEDIDDDDDDGWGTGSSDAKTQELRKLQQERLDSQGRTPVAYSSSSPSSSGSNAEEERDLFIPIFAIVSILGFTGAYGYEMLRLASRGELYLPWGN